MGPQSVFGINWNNVVEHIVMWVGVILILGLVWIFLGLPAYFKGWLEKKHKKVPKLLDDHIVIIEIVWIAVWLYIGYHYSPI